MYESNKSGSPQPAHTGLERDEKGRQGSNDKREQAAKRQEKLDDALDRALEESFPGSDPISVAQPPQSVYDKHDRQKR
jgi:hypothetical protein